MASSPSSGGRNNAKKNDGLDSLLRSMGGGDDCDRPACDNTKSALSAALERVGRSNNNKDASAAESTSRQIRKKLRSVTDKSVRKGYRACPPTRDEIGVSTWSLLHSMAAWYPDQPTSEEQKSMSSFMSALARFYPCTWCAEDFQNSIRSSPPRTETRKDLCMWLCEQHNIVNDKIGKPLFHCMMDNLDERWRKSNDPDCQK